MENPALASPAEVVISDCTILCSRSRAAGAQILFWEHLSSLETQTVHLAIRAVSTASWQRKAAAFLPGQRALGRTNTLRPREIGRAVTLNLLLPSTYIFASCILANNICIRCIYIWQRGKLDRNCKKKIRTRMVLKGSYSSGVALSIHPSIQYPPTDRLFYASAELGVADSLMTVTWFLSLRNTQLVGKKNRI